MMVEPRDVDAACEQDIERRPVDVERDVEHRDAVAFARVDALEQADVALRAGDEMAVPRRGESKLMQCAQPVGIAVEDVVEVIASPGAHIARQVARRTSGGSCGVSRARGRQ